MKVEQEHVKEYRLDPASERKDTQTVCCRNLYMPILVHRTSWSKFPTLHQRSIASVARERESRIENSDSQRLENMIL